MNKHLPLDNFEREVQRLADGFEIQPRALVFDNIRSEIAADAPHAATKGKILKGVFSKSLNFISYAAAASVATISSVLIYQQQESVHQQQQSLASYTKIQSNQSQQLTHSLSNSTDTLSYNTALNEIAATEQQQNELVLTTESGKINPTEKDVLPELALAKEVKSQPVRKKQSTTASIPFLSKQEVKNTQPTKESGIQNNLVNGTSQPATQPQNALPAGNERQPNNQSSNEVQTPVLVTQSVAPTEKEAEPARNNSGKQLTEEVLTVKQNDSSMMAVAPLTADSSVTSFASADSAANDTTGAKRLAARNWVKKGVWSIAAFYSQEKSNRNLEVPVASDPGYYYDSYQSFRNVTDQQSSSFTAGFKTDYNFMNHFGITTGLTYAQRKEQISVDKYEEMVFNFAEATWDIHTTTAAGYSEVITNTFTYLEVPLLLNYNNTIAGRFAYRLSAGASYAYLMKQSAYFVNFDDRTSIMGPAPIYSKESQIGNTPFRQHNFNLQLGAYVSYLFNQRMEVYAGPNYKRSLLSTYKDKYPFRQQFHAIGAEMGLRIYF
ncbi:MAG: porin family protein [Bacteroidia bacterium]